MTCVTIELYVPTAITQKAGMLQKPPSGHHSAWVTVDN